MSLQTILGTMTFSDQVDYDTAAQMILEFQQAGHKKLDTAYVYNNGKTEELLGELSAAGKLGDCTLDCKANPWAENGLTPSAINKQMDTSLKRLGRQSVNLYYLHAPDLNTPVIDSLAAINRLHQGGKFTHFGLSNYAAWQVAEVIEISKQEGWILPTVYQGMYNAYTRDVERELFPCLANYGISFYVYNPLAGGLLTGKHTAHDVLPDDGRFATFNGYQDRYWKAEYFSVVNEFKHACAAQNIKPAAAAIRWLAHHSELAGDDAGHAIILGASSMEHFRQNLQACSAGPLPESIVDTLNAGWEKVRPACIKYFRP